MSLDFPTWGMYVNTALAEQYCPEVLEDNIVTWDEIMAVGASLQEQGVEDVSVLAGSWDPQRPAELLPRSRRHLRL